MTNKEKLEIIDKKLDELYENLKKGNTKDLLLKDYCFWTQAIYNLEQTKKMLESENQESKEVEYATNDNV